MSPVEATTNVGEISVAALDGKVLITFDDVTYVFPVPNAKELSVAVMKKAFEAEGKEAG